jgi:cytochrome b561
MMSERTDYLVGQKIVHWLMALLLIMDLFVAQKFGGFLETWDRLESRADHGSLGTIVAVLFLIRLYYLFRYGPPPLPANMPSWQVKAARLGHGLLYFGIGFLIVSGLTTAANAASPVTLFGRFDITIGQTDETTFDFIRQFHEFTTEAVIVLIVIHVLAALHHHFVAKDDTTRRMLRFWKTM